MKLAIYIQGDCVVGEWDLKIKTALLDKVEDFVYEYPQPLVILFNPWSSGEWAGVSGFFLVCFFTDWTAIVGVFSVCTDSGGGARVSLLLLLFLVFVFLFCTDWTAAVGVFSVGSDSGGGAGVSCLFFVCLCFVVVFLLY